MLDRRDFLITGALAAASWVWPPQARSSSVYPLKLTGGDRLLFATQVNGHAVEALLDSAAEASILDSDASRAIASYADARSGMMCERIVAAAPLKVEWPEI